jgi:hypothetical protein
MLGSELHDREERRKTQGRKHQAVDAAGIETKALWLYRERAKAGPCMLVLL